ncbi:DUF4390 domain-containing protein [Variovorax dokdonensis]|uniref:DUF4390 domain-containing protein n=1 Tax=Variovorax dokdonensis TaxID=344883 RepID=A0ABT7NAQ1_9BURK|nr:DUF4390 domain-containing protein [Variovorax dokdonensis]MDM0045007.1 DUF4390 domain-containing protein [Variovorax dokdonensis]
MAVVLLLASPAARAEAEAELTQLRLERVDDGVYLSATVQFSLPELVGEVLDKGIAVYFVADAELYRERWYWWNSRIASVSRHMRLAYQPLTRRWRLNVSPVPITNAGFGNSVAQNFDSLEDALEAVKRVGRLRLADASAVGDDPEHLVMFRFRLDTSQLPRPFQIGAVGQSDWNISIERNVKLPLENNR